MGCSGYNMVVDLVQACSLMPKSGLEGRQQNPAGRKGWVTGLCSETTILGGTISKKQLAHGTWDTIQLIVRFFSQRNRICKHMLWLTHPSWRRNWRSCSCRAEREKRNEPILRTRTNRKSVDPCWKFHTPTLLLTFLTRVLYSTKMTMVGHDFCLWCCCCCSELFF